MMMVAFMMMMMSFTWLTLVVTCFEPLGTSVLGSQKMPPVATPSTFGSSEKERQKTTAAADENEQMKGKVPATPVATSNPAIPL